jgi:hypothetical protein
MTRSAVYRDHILRDPEMRRHPETRAIFGAYDQLKKAAHEARYEATPFRDADVPRFQEFHRTIRDAMLAALPALGR